MKPLLLVLGLLSLSALWAFPVFRLPAPSGKYAIGVLYETVLTDRPEAFTEDTSDKRILYTKVWYPAEKTAEYKLNPYTENGVGSVLAEQFDFPVFVLSHFGDIKTHGYLNAPIAKGSFPLLTFSHGYGSWFGQNTALMEELASRGFVVVSIAHSHQTAIAASGPESPVEFPAVVPLEEEAATGGNYSLYDSAMATTDKPKMRRLLEMEMQRSGSINHYAERWAADIASVLDHVLASNGLAEGWLYPSIDTTRIGAFGMSFGGAASGEIALKDARVRASINLDGAPYGTWIKDTMRKPMLLLEAQRSEYRYSMYAPVLNRATSQVQIMQYKNAKHYNFTDANLFSPALEYIGILGKVDRRFMLQEMNRVVPAYFEAVLTGRSFSTASYLQDSTVYVPLY